jgi:hypothetical protein
LLPVLTPYFSADFFELISDEFRIAHVSSYVCVASSYVDRMEGSGPPSICAVSSPSPVPPSTTV